MHIGQPMNTKGLRGAAKIGVGNSLPKGAPVTKAQTKSLLSQFNKFIPKVLIDMGKQLAKLFGSSSPSPKKEPSIQESNSTPSNVTNNSDQQLNIGQSSFFNFEGADLNPMPSSFDSITGSTPLKRTDSTSSMDSNFSDVSDITDSTIGDLKKSFHNSEGELVEIGETLAEHFMKDGNHEGANGTQINEMSKIANTAFATVLKDSGNDSLASAIEDSGDVGDAIENAGQEDSFAQKVTDHFEKHEVLTLSHFGYKGHSVGLNVFKNKDQTFDIVLCNRGAGNQIPGDADESGTFFQVTVNNLEEANTLLHTLHDLKQSETDMGPIYQAMKNAAMKVNGETTAKVLTDVTAKDQYTGHCGFLNKQAALKQVSKRMTGDIKAYKSERKELFKGIQSYIQDSDNNNLKTSLTEYKNLQKVTQTLKGLAQRKPVGGSEGVISNPQDSGKTIGQMDVDGIASAINALKDDGNFKSEMGRVMDYIDQMLKNDSLSNVDQSFLIDVKNNMINLNNEEIDQSTFLENVTNLKKSYDQLQNATLDTFKDAVGNMTDEQFNVSKRLIQETAERLFKTEAKGTFEDGAWITNTPTQKALFALAQSENRSDLNANFETLTTAKALDQYTDQLSQTLETATLDTFQSALDGMTDEQFNVSKRLIQETAERLFKTEAKGTFEDGAWITNTPTQKALFALAQSENRSNLNANFETLTTAKALDQYTAQLSQTLETATLATFKDAVGSMTDEQFNVSKRLIQETAKRLFETEANGTFAQNGAWQLKTPTDRVIFNIVTSGNVADLKTHLNSLTINSEFQSNVQSMGNGDYTQLEQFLSAQTIDTLTMAECQLLMEKIDAQTKNASDNKVHLNNENLNVVIGFQDKREALRKKLMHIN